MNIEDLEQVAELQIKLVKADNLLSDVLAADGAAFQAFAKVPAAGGLGRLSHVDIPAVLYDMVLAVAQAQRKAVVEQLTALGVRVN